MPYSLKYLQSKPTLEPGLVCDLKVVLPRRRIWLCRTTEHTVVVEALKKGEWKVLEEYPAAQEED